MKTFSYLKTIVLLITFFATDALQAEATVNPCRMRDSLALVEFYNAAHENGAWVNEWNLNLPMDTWWGITLDENGCVESFDTRNPTEPGKFINNNFSGQLPPEFGNLLDLDTLILTAAHFDTIPDEIGNLESLKFFRLTGGSFQNEHLPAAIGNLTNLTLFQINSVNGLTGPIPPEIGNLSNLVNLLLRADFTGGIPVEIAQLENLETLGIFNNNNLGGTIPPEIGSMSKLKSIFMWRNGLTGSIPKELANLSDLQGLYLYNNNLTGNIPSDLRNLTTLNYFVLHDNNLTGNIPSNLFSETFQPVLIELQNNNLNGVLPEEIAQLKDLRVLDLSQNNFSGNLPENLADIFNTVLRQVTLNGNNFTGTIPSSYSVFCGIDSVNLLNNPLLPGGGDFDAFCASGTGGAGYECSTAVPLSLNSEPCGRNAQTVFLANATTSAESLLGNCDGFAGNDVWFKALLPPSGKMLIQINDNTNIVPVVEVVQGVCGSFHLLTCDTLDSFPQVLIVDSLNLTDSVYIRIWDLNNAVVDVNPDAQVEVSVHTLSSNPEEWVICDFPTTAPNSNNSEEPSGGKRSASQFIVQYKDNATPAEIQSIRDDLLANGSELVDDCDCETTPIELWKAIDPIDLEERKREAQTRNSKVDTITYNYVVETLPCLDTLREFQVNTTETGAQIDADIAMNSSGESVVVWRTGNSVYGQLFDSDGTKRGAEFSFMPFLDSPPKVGMDEEGNFIVVWEQSVVDAGYTVWAQFFDRNANPIDSQFIVDEFNKAFHPPRHPDVAMNDNGNVVVVYEDVPTFEPYSNIVGRQYVLSGNTVIEGSVFTVNTTTDSSQVHPVVAINGLGDFVVAWQSSNYNNFGFNSILAQKFDNTGATVGGEIEVSEIVLSEVSSSGETDIEIYNDGTFSATWIEYTATYAELNARWFDENCNPMGPIIDFNDQSLFDRFEPSISGAAQDITVITWESFGQDGSGRGIYSQRFDKFGNKIGPEFRVNTSTDASQQNPVVAMDATGNFTVVWDGASETGDKTGIHAQRYQNVTYDNVSYAVPLAGTSPCLGVPGEQLPMPVPPVYEPSNPQSRVRVAVLDTGVEDNHDRLQNAIWMNDDPMEGCVQEDFIGYDFVNDTVPPMDIDGHGTAVNGVIANGFPTDVQLELMNVKFHESEEGTVFDAVCSIYYAIEEGADIINLSWGFESGEFPTILHDAITKAEEAGVLIVTSAGNTGKNNDKVKKYPANLDNENIIAVTAYEKEEENTEPRLAYYASFGKGKVDLAAEGYLETSALGNGVSAVAGTSIATPQVAQVAAMLKGKFPVLSAADIKSCILESVQPASALSTKVSSGGVLNVQGALDCAAVKSQELACSMTEFNVPEYLNTDVLYKSDNTITSTSIIEPGVTVVMSSEEAVVLQDGFHARAGTDFTASSQGCSFSPLSALSESKSSDILEKNRTAKEAPTFETPQHLRFDVAPNPFSERTRIQLYLPKAAYVHLTLYDANGRLLTEIAQEQAAAGWYETTLQANDLNAGIYYVRLQTSQSVLVKKVLVFR